MQLLARVNQRARHPYCTHILLGVAMNLALILGCSSGVGRTDGDGGGAPGANGGAPGANGGVPGANAGAPGTNGGAAGTSGTLASIGGAGSASGGAAPSGGAGSSNGGQSSGGGSGSGVSGGPSTPAVHYVGRVDADNPASVRFAWSGTGAVVRFRGDRAAVDLGGGQEYTVLVDGKLQPKLTATNGKNVLAQGLSADEHTIELYRRTEASQGESEIRGFDFGTGQLLAPAPVTRRLEFVGDSITCGYGNEGANASCDFSAQTENHYLSYAAITARNLHAELSTVAWSGKGVACNYGDDASSCTDPLPTYYARTLPNRVDSNWDFSLFQPDAVVVNLGTNDLSTSIDPDKATFEAAYRALLQRIRQAYPTARILCTNGPLLNGTELTTVRGYITDVVTSMADARITTFEIEPQDGSDGYGCQYHPSLAEHQKVAAVVTAALKTALGW